MCLFIRLSHKWKQCVAKYKVKLNTHLPCVLFSPFPPFCSQTFTRWLPFNFPAPCMFPFSKPCNNFLQRIWHINRVASNRQRFHFLILGRKWCLNIVFIYLSPCHNHPGPFQHRPLRGGNALYLLLNIGSWSSPRFALKPFPPGSFYLVASILDLSVLKQDLPLPSHQLPC